MTPGPRRRHGPRCGPAAGAAVLLAALLLDGLLGGCGPAGQAAARTTAARAPAAPPPASADALGRLLITDVPSGLPRMPDGQLRPPAGEKSLDDVAAYAGNPTHERQVLRRYGFRWGWERFWGRGAAETSVFVEQFTAAGNARSFAADLAANEAEHYRAVLHEHPPGLSAGCRLLTVDRPAPDVDLAGPAALAWCASGVFSVAVSVVGTSVDAATGEVVSVVRAQLSRLPG